MMEVYKTKLNSISSFQFIPNFVVVDKENFYSTVTQPAITCSKLTVETKSFSSL